MHNTQKTLNRCPAQTLAPTFLGESSLHPKSLLPPLGLTSLTQLQNLRAEGNLRYHLHGPVIVQEEKPRHNSSSARLIIQVPTKLPGASRVQEHEAARTPPHLPQPTPRPDAQPLPGPSGASWKGYLMKHPRFPAATPRDPSPALGPPPAPGPGHPEDASRTSSPVDFEGQLLLT